MEMLNLPQEMLICEVGPRDGLQSEQKFLTLEQKLELINMSIDAGCKVIEVGSFVSPKAIPQMADTDDLCKLLPQVEGVEYRGLIFNLKGLKRAEAAGLKKCQLTVSASKGHCLANMNKTPEEAVASFAECVEYANEHGIALCAAMATSFGCPIDGHVPFEQVVSVAKCLSDMGVKEITLADTTGMANPKQVFQYMNDIQKLLPDVDFGLHFHNTRGLGLANVMAGLMTGITRYDASYAGTGGCPFAPGASGNIATEDLLNMANEIGIKTGMDIDKCLALGRKVEEYVGGKRSSSLLRAGKCSDIVAKNKK